ncbi:MAG: CorA family divalent cation transporter [Polyangiaceae bacterium]
MAAGGHWGAKLSYRLRVLRVLEVPQGGRAVERGDDEIRAPRQGELFWLDVQEPTREVLERLREPFGLHPLAIDDCLTHDQRPKLEEYPGHVFVVIHELSLEGDEISGREIHAFLGANFLITVRDHPCRRVDDVVTRVLGANDLYERGVAFIYLILVMRKPAAFRARIVDSRPGPGPLTITSRFLIP